MKASKIAVNNATQGGKHAMSSTHSKLGAERSHRWWIKEFWYTIFMMNHYRSFVTRVKVLEYTCHIDAEQNNFAALEILVAVL